jgi:CRISPR-associated endonuclease/helicase Cas3
MTVEHDIVDMSFPIRGRAVPRDHGYALYAALCRELPALHGAAWLGVHPIRGERLVSDAIGLRGHSTVTLRVPLSEIGTVLPLAGRSLDVGGALIALRTPTVAKLAPSEALDARAVVFKLTDVARSTSPTLEKKELERAFRTQLARVLTTLVERAVPGSELTGRQQVTVGGRRVVGYSVRLTGLAPTESLRIQAAGVGGKRRMGCGVFTPSRRRAR